MTFMKPPAIEPLSDLSWQRLERQVFAELESQPLFARGQELGSATAPTERDWSRRRVFGLTAAAAAAAMAIIWLSSSEPSDVASAPSRVVTEGAPSQISVGDAALTVAPHSALLVSDTASGVLTVLDRGSVRCKVGKRGHRPPFVVQAGEVRVEVVGTHFAVTRTGDSAQVEVFEGVVSVIAQGERTRVAAGQHWPATAAAYVPAVSAGPTPAAAAPRRQPAHATEPEPASAAPAPTKKQRYEDAVELSASDPDAALAMLAELAAEGGRWGANALYAQAQLELDRDHRAAATRLLDEYLRRFPSGQNAEDVRRELERIGQ